MKKSVEIYGSDKKQRESVLYVQSIEGELSMFHKTLFFQIIRTNRYAWVQYACLRNKNKNLSLLLCLWCKKPSFLFSFFLLHLRYIISCQGQKFCPWHEKLLQIWRRAYFSIKGSILLSKVIPCQAPLI